MFRKTKILTVLLISIVATLSPKLHAQKETNNWIMGLIDNWVTFTENGPVMYSPPNNVPGLFVDFFESAANASSVSDKDGNLLLYTNGIKVWNSQLNQVPGNSGMSSDLGTCILTPTPGNQKRYYVFSNYPHGLSSVRLRQIDYSLNNGAGGNTLIQYLPNFSVSKISTHYHSNGKDIWLLTHDWGNNKFRTYLITEQDLPYNPWIDTSAVISDVGLVQEDTTIVDLCNSAAWGKMKFSPGGNYVAMTSTGLDAVEIFDFDRETGIVSNPRTITIDRPYSLEFSPNGTFMYFCQYYSCYDNSNCNTPYNDSLPVYQVDLLAGNDSAIANTMVSVSGASLFNLNYYGYRLQLASDLNIYVAHSNNASVINEPNLPESFCSWSDSAFYFDVSYPGNGPIQALPDFFRSYLDFNIMFDNACYGNITAIYTLTNQGFDSIRWEFEDTTAGLSFSIPNQDTVYHQFSQIGEYEIVLKRYRHGNLDELKRILRINPIADIALLEDTLLCEGEQVMLVASDTICEFGWVNDFSTDTIFGDTANVSQQGNWWPVVTNFEEHCGVIDSIEILVLPDTLDLGPDAAPNCTTSLATLVAELPGNNAYLWSTGDTTSSIIVPEDGWYSVTVQQEHCTYHDTVLIVYDEPLPVSLFDTTMLCDSIPENISAGDFNADFLWSPNGETTADILVASPGSYSVTASNGCGDFIDSTVAINVQSPSVNLGNDTLVCSGDTVPLENQSMGAYEPATYSWSTGEASESIGVIQANTYSLMLSNHCGTAMDSMVVETVDTPIVNIGNDTTICLGDPLVLSTTSSPYSTYLWSTGESSTGITVYDAGLYALSVTNTCGTYSDSLFLTTHENTFAFPFDTLWLNVADSIDAGSGYTSYLWWNGSTTQSIAANDSGLHWVEVTDSMGCYGSDSVWVNFLDGISSPSSLSGIKVYPNPVKDELVVEFGGTDYKSAPAISLWNSLGQRVSTRTPTQSGGTSSGLTLDTSTLPKGIYLLSISQGNEKTVVKVVKE